MVLKRYSIWDKQSQVITPSGEVFTAEQWKERYPIANLPQAIIVGGAGMMNGSFFGELSQMVAMYEEMGCDFTGLVTPEEKLEAIEAFEDMQNDPGDITESTPEERIAAALETQVMLSMGDVNDDDPDLLLREE